MSVVKRSQKDGAENLEGLTGDRVGPQSEAGESSSDRSAEGFPPLLMLVLFVGLIICLSLYYMAGVSLQLNYFELLIITTVSVSAVTGGYQFFFWIQCQSQRYPSRSLALSLDHAIPFAPRWVWVYSLGYYALIVFTLISVPTMESALRLIFAGLLLLIAHSACAFFLPTTVPTYWRHYAPDTLSKRFLQLIQRYDNGRSCFPSMHCALTTFACFLLQPSFGMWPFLFLSLIVTSCLLVKQHQIVDIPPGIALGWFTYLAFTNW